MKPFTTTSQHCLSFALLRLQGASVVWTGFMVKYGLEIGMDNRSQEVRG